MKLLQINTAGGRGASGGIPEALHQMALKRDIYARMVIGRGEPSPLRIRVGSMPTMVFHLAATRFLDRHGLHSRKATRSLIERIERIDPDIIHLHNIHGYYLHYPTLMDYIRQYGRPVVWTLHDCWPFTGHCPFPIAADCNRWVDGCHRCPLRGQYPASWLADRSQANYELKRDIFSGLTNVTLVPVGNWIDRMLRSSFLSYLPRQIVRNGIDLGTFRPAASKSQAPLVLGVASKWDDRKGLREFIRLREVLPPNWRIRLIGLTGKQQAAIDKIGNIESIRHISDPSELAVNYSRASIFVNPTKGESSSITKMEALACGTPVVTYDAGGAGEGITSECGAVVPAGRFDLLVDAILNCKASPADCRAAAESRFDMQHNLEGYFDLYRRLIAQSKQPM